jgi:amphi-Trp domain-containing protein
VSDLELKRKESLTRTELAKRLSAFADALGSGHGVELEMDGMSMSLRVPDDVRVEFEVEVDGDEIEVEVEVKWSTSSPAGQAEPTSDEHDVDAGDTAQRANGKRGRRS